MKIKDSIALGSFAGIMATIPQLLLDTVAYYSGYSKYHGYQFAAGIFLYKDLTNTLLGNVLGMIIWASMAALLGISIVYLMKLTGRDYWWLKGLLISNGVMYIFIYGFLLTLGGSNIVPFDIPTNITIFFGNAIFGIICSYIIYRWGAEKIFK